MAGTARGNQNRLYTPNVIAYEGLQRLMYELMLPRLASNNYGAYFENQIGDTITVKRPYRAKAHKGRVMQTGDISQMIDQTVEIKVNQRYNFALNYNDEERTLDIVDFGERYLKEGILEIAQGYEEEGMEELFQNTYRHVGSAGTALTPKRAKLVRARAKKVAIPQNRMNHCIMDPMDLAEIGEDIEKIANPTTGSNSALQDVYKGKLSGWNVFDSGLVPDYVAHSGTNVAQGTMQIDGANQKGDTLTLKGLGNAKSGYMAVGQMFTIAGVHETRVRGGRGGNRERTGGLMTFTCTSAPTSNGSGKATIGISPTLNPGGGALTVADPGGGAALSLDAYQNVSNSPANSAVVTQIGGFGNRYRQAVWFESNALEYVPIVLAPLSSAVWQGQAIDDQTGLNVSLIRWIDGLKREETTRMDSMFGVKMTYADLAIRTVTGEIE